MSEALFQWGSVKDSSTAALIAQRANLARYCRLAIVSNRLMDIQRELDERAAARLPLKPDALLRKVGMRASQRRTP